MLVGGNIDADVVKWLEDKLSEERVMVESLHRALIEELCRSKCGDMKQEQRNGFASKELPSIHGIGETDDCGKKKRVSGAYLDRHATCDVFDDSDEGRQSTVVSQRSVPAVNLLGNGKDTRKPNNCFHVVVQNKYFEWFFGVLIVFNLVAMAFEAQYAGLGLGYELGFQGYNSDKLDIWPRAEMAFSLLDYIFGVAYTVELVFKIIGLRKEFFDLWNAFDLFIVTMWYVDTFLRMFTLPIDMMLLRLTRLARLLRLIKLIKKMSGFDQLFLMLTALKGCSYMLAWSSLLLSTCLVTVAFFLNQVLFNYYMSSEDVPHEKRVKCFMYFGNFSRSLFTMFELTVANWIPVSRFLMDNVSEWFVIFAIAYKMTFGFAVIAVINGCFIKETFKTADADDLLMVLSKKKESKIHLQKMMKLLAAADASGDGVMDLKEWVAACNQPDVAHWLAAQGLNAGEACMLFELMDDGSGTLGALDLASGVGRLKGPATSLGLAIHGHANELREQAVVAQIGELVKKSVRSELAPVLARHLASNESGHSKQRCQHVQPKSVHNRFGADMRKACLRREDL